MKVEVLNLLEAFFQMNRLTFDMQYQKKKVYLSRHRYRHTQINNPAPLCPAYRGLAFLSECPFFCLRDTYRMIILMGKNSKIKN
ncbi:hypothetical protein ACRRTK_024653 [Alexandromys fortis]